MKKRIHRLLVFALALELLVSSVGVAQVSHFCKLAIAGMESTSCSEKSNEEHACCNMDNQKNDLKSDKESCCKEQIKYFQNKVNCNIQEIYHPAAIEIIELTLLCQAGLFSEKPLNNLCFQQHEFSPGDSGKKIILSKSSLLI